MNKIKTALFFLSVILLICLIILICFRVDSVKSDKLNKQIQASYETKNDSDESNGKKIDWAKLKEDNSDAVAWLNIYNSEIDIPIVQASNNEFYLHKNFYKKYAYHGNAFMDYRNNMDVLDENTVIYGHNMRDGKEFGSLLKMYSTVDEAKKHTYIKLQTEENEYVFLLIGAFYTNSKAEDDNGYVFPYTITSMGSGVYSDFLNQLEQRFLYSTGIEIDNSDKILTLSTCSYTYKEERFVVIGRLLRDNEALSEVEFNFEKKLLPRYPQKWYDKQNCKNPYIRYEQWKPEANSLTM